MANPCLTCGACCAFYRVSFHWSETVPFTGGVTPEAMTVQVSPHRVAMSGTEHVPPRCTALEGAPAERVRCTIYARRPSPCREFAASWAEGTRNERCDRARRAHGLAPLDPPLAPRPSVDPERKRAS